MQFLHRGNADIVRGTFLGSLAFGVSSGVAGDPMDKTAIAKLKWNPSTHCSAFRTDTERLLYFVIDWLEPLSIFGSLVFNCLQEKAPVWWYDFSIAFRSSGSWQVDSTSWVCWSRTAKQTSVFSWALEADAVLSRRRVEVWSTWLGQLSHTILRLILHEQLSRPLVSCISYSTIKRLLDLLFCRMGGQIFRLVNKPSWVTWLLYDSSRIETAEFSVGNLGVQPVTSVIVLCHHVLVDSVWGILYGARASF